MKTIITLLGFAAGLHLVNAQPSELKPKPILTNNAIILQTSTIPVQNFDTPSVFSCSTLPALLPERQRPPNMGEAMHFLRSIPEFQEIGLLIQPKELERIIETNGIYATKTVSNRQPTYWLLTERGENIFVMFTAEGDCRGIQRMSPIPVGAIEKQIGKDGYAAWQERLKKMKR